MSKEISINNQEYGNILKQAIEQIRTARIVIAKQLNTATQSVYWNLGKLLFEKKLAEGYGSGVVNQLSIDLKKEFPDMGLSPRNLWNMKLFYERYYQADQKLLQAVAVLLFDKLEKGENENQSIGIILCADKDHLDVEIALQDVGKPIGVAEYQLLLPKDKLQNLLIDEIKKSES